MQQGSNLNNGEQKKEEIKSYVLYLIYQELQQKIKLPASLKAKQLIIKAKELFNKKTGADFDGKELELVNQKDKKPLDINLTIEKQSVNNDALILQIKSSNNQNRTTQEKKDIIRNQQSGGNQIKNQGNTKSQARNDENELMHLFRKQMKIQNHIQKQIQDIQEQKMKSNIVEIYISSINNLKAYKGNFTGIIHNKIAYNDTYFDTTQFSCRYISNRNTVALSFLKEFAQSLNIEFQHLIFYKVNQVKYIEEVVRFDTLLLENPNDPIEKYCDQNSNLHLLVFPIINQLNLQINKLSLKNSLKVIQNEDDSQIQQDQSEEYFIKLNKIKQHQQQMNFKGEQQKIVKTSPKYILKFKKIQNIEQYKDMIIQKKNTFQVSHGNTNKPLTVLFKCVLPNFNSVSNGNNLQNNIDGIQGKLQYLTYKIVSNQTTISEVTAEITQEHQLDQKYQSQPDIYIERQYKFEKIDKLAQIQKSIEIYGSNQLLIIVIDYSKNNEIKKIEEQVNDYSFFRFFNLQNQVSQFSIIHLKTDYGQLRQFIAQNIYEKLFQQEDIELYMNNKIEVKFDLKVIADCDFTLSFTIKPQKYQEFHNTLKEAYKKHIEKNKQNQSEIIG